MVKRKTREMLKKLGLSSAFAGALVYSGILNTVFVSSVTAEEKKEEEKKEGGHLIQLATEDEAKDEKKEDGHLVQ